ncbi:hypothetical protein EMPG_12276 [Blastomyces silverae]|uniref:Uncharacterized protein n=1 Tax=Blastomyces silverae TaxID=2060906 RepID=A0A0H1BUI9_9EURO|nr:hypothetical protein EMPG_12276 [Blastomyces silverae]
MNENEHEYRQDTPTPGPRGEPGQMNKLMMRMMAYMEKQDRLMEILIQKLGGDSDSLSTWNQMDIFEQRDDLMDQLATRATVITPTPATAAIMSSTATSSTARTTVRITMRTTTRTTVRTTTRATHRCHHYKPKPHKHQKGEG